MILSPLKQRHVEAFLKDLAAKGIDPTASYNGRPLSDQVERWGVINRAAASAGMLNGVEPDDLTPVEAARLAGGILVAVGEALAVPKES